MYPVSTLFSDLIKEPSRPLKSKVIIRSNEYQQEKIIEIVVDETVNPDDSYTIGSVASAKLDLTIIDINDVAFENAVVKPYIGLEIGGIIEYVPLGVFNVDDIDRVKNKTKLTCFDNMIKLEKPYFSDLIYPNTLNNVAQEICSKAGVTLATTLQTIQINEISGYTLREAIGFIASSLGGFARFNRNGELEIITYTDSGIEVTGANYTDLDTSENPFTIGRLSCRVNNDDGEVILSAGTIGNEIQFENPIMTQTQLDAIYNTLKTVSYMPYNMKWQGNPALQAGDKIRIVDTKGNIFDTLLMDQQIRYTGGLSVVASAKGKTATATEFSSSGTMAKKIERQAIEQALIKEALIYKASIQDLEAANARIDNLYAEDLVALNAQIQNLQVAKLDVDVANLKFASIENLVAEKANITDLTAAVGRITILESDVADIDTILAKQVFAELVQFGQILAGSSIIAEGAIGSAHISDLSASKLTAGIADLSLVTIQGTDGRLKIQDNRLQVFAGNPLFERVALGDVNGDGTAYGLRIRGADGTTILFDENGQTKEGFTDGYNKLDNNSLNPAKLDIAAVVTRINNGTTTIESSKIYMDNKTLDVAFSTIETTLNSQGQTIASQGLEITAISDGLSLKVDTQTYTTDMAGVNSQLSTQSSALSVLQSEVAIKVTQSDIDNSISPLTSRISSAEATLITHADQISARVTTTTYNAGITEAKAHADTKVDGLEIGGRNLVLGADYENNLTIGPSTLKTWALSAPDKVIGKKVTLSFYGKSSNGNNRVYMSIAVGSSTRTNITGNIILPQEYTKFTFTFTASSDIDINSFMVVYGTTWHASNVGSISIKELKLESGSKGTGWTPAPEDVTAQITAAHAAAISHTDTQFNILNGQIDLRVLQTTYNTDKANLETAIASKRRVFTSTPIAPYDIGDIWINGTILRRCSTAKASGQTYALADWTQVNNRVFTSQPAPPYIVGDIWVQGDVANSEIMRCNTARASGSYTASDWVKASNYGTRITSAESSLSLLSGEISAKVSQTDYNGNTIASLLNLTSTTAKIEAQKINLVGAITVQDLASGVQDAILQKIADGSYTGGSFISGTTIYSPTITAGVLNSTVLNSVEINTDKGINIGQYVRMPVARPATSLDAVKYLRGDGGITFGTKAAGDTSYPGHIGVVDMGATVSDPNPRIHMVIKGADIDLQGIVKANGYTVDAVVDHNLNTDGAYGYYIRYNNGLQICFSSVTIPTLGTAYTEQTIWWYPAAFLTHPAFTGATFMSSRYGSDRIYIRATQWDANRAIIGMWSPHQVSENLKVGLIAMGRWK